MVVGAVDLIGGGAAKRTARRSRTLSTRCSCTSCATPSSHKAATAEAAEACEVSYDDGGEVEGEAAAWERLAEAYEASRDIEGAIYAYERLLLLEPPSAATLPPAVAAKRSVQELVLLSHRRGLQDARAVGSAVKATAGSAVEAGQGVGEAAVATFTERALADVRGLRRVIEGDLDVLESTIAALADMTADDNEEGEVESREVEEPPPPGSPPTLLARKAKGDVGTLRKIVRNDFHVGAPAAARRSDAVGGARPAPVDLGWRGGGGAALGGLAAGDAAARAVREELGGRRASARPGPRSLAPRAGEARPRARRATHPRGEGPERPRPQSARGGARGLIMYTSVASMLQGAKLPWT